MLEIRLLLFVIISKSFVFIDEICRGIEIVKGICIVGSIVEIFDVIGCLGIVLIYLYGIFDLLLRINKIVYKVMSIEFVDG